MKPETELRGYPGLQTAISNSVYLHRTIQQFVGERQRTYPHRSDERIEIYRWLTNRHKKRTLERRA